MRPWLALGLFVALCAPLASAQRKGIDEQLLDASKSGNAKRIAELTSRGANPDAKNADGWPALTVATAEGHLAAVRALVAASANIDLGNDTGDTPLLLASMWGQTEIVLFLVQKGADVNLASHVAITPLMVANNAEIARALLKAGAKVNAKDETGETALHWKCGDAGDDEIVTALIEAGADVNVVPNDGRTALQRARTAKRQETVKLLLKAGAKR